MTLRTILLYIPVLLSLHTVSSQNKYHATWYSADSNHLPQNSVKSIVADKYGYIWLSTESGIVRYDGRDFKLFNSGNLPTITSDRMFMFGGEISNDSIIIRNDSQQMLLIKKRKVEVLDTPLPYNASRKIKYTYMEALHPYHFSLPQEVFRLVADDGHFIISKNNIKKYSRKKKLLYDQAHTYADSTQFFTMGSSLYRLIKNRGYARIENNAEYFGKFDIPLDKDHVILNNMTHRQVFLRNGKQLFYLTENQGSIHSHLVYEQFDHTINIHSVYYDIANNVLYLGSANKGLLVVRKHNFKFMASPFKHNTGTDGVYYGMTQLSDDKILASTGDIFINGKHADKMNFGNNSDKYCIAIDSKGDIWLKTHEKVSRYNKTLNFKTYDSWDLQGRISILAEGKDGNIWIGTGQNEPNYKGSVFCVNPLKPHDEPKLFLRLPFTPICLSWVNADVFYAGSLNGLYKINAKSRTAEKIKTFPGVYVRSITVMGPNEIWVATYDNGIYLYKDTKATHFPLDRNKYMLNTHCILADGRGYLWLTTNRGIFQVKRQDLLNYAGGRTGALYYYHHNKSAGFLNNEFNGGCYPCGIYRDKKTMYLPSMDGIVYFNPAKINPNTPRNNIYIDEIDVDGKTREIKDTLHLSRNFGRIKIYVSSPYSGDPYNQNFEVRLDGPVAQGWLPLAENHIAFTTLPPGDYKVTVRKLTGFGGKWIYKNISFTVIPAFWQQTWFFILTALLTGVAIYIAIKLRVRYIRYKNILLEKKIVEQTAQLRNTVSALRKSQHDLNMQVNNHKKLIKLITHDIKSPLRFMAITGKYLYNKLGGNDTGVEDDLLAIHSSSAQLYEFVDNFLEYAKESNNSESEPYLLHGLVEEKVALFRNLALSRKTTIANTTPPDLKLSINRHLLSIILHNLTDNAVKHTYDGTIVITATVQDNLVVLAVKDTGEGMAAHQVQLYIDMFNNSELKEESEGMGLPIIIELLHILNGLLHIASQPGEGTAITLYFNMQE